MKSYKNLQEIIKLSEHEIDTNDDSVSAVLNLEDLKELKNLLIKYKELEAFAAGKTIHELGISDLYKN